MRKSSKPPSSGKDTEAITTSGYVSKQHASSELIAAIRKALAGGRYITPAMAEALAATRAAHGDWYHSITKLWHDHDDHMPDSLFSWETSTQHETILFGSPTRVREQMAELLDVSGCNYVICAFAWGTFPHEQTLRSLRLFAEEVMPAFR